MQSVSLPKGLLDYAREIRHKRTVDEKRWCYIIWMHCNDVEAHDRYCKKYCKSWR